MASETKKAWETRYEEVKSDKPYSSKAIEAMERYSNRSIRNELSPTNAEKTEVAAVMSSVPWLVSKPKTDEELIQRFDDYFRNCSERDIRPTVEGLAVAAGVDTATILRWENGEQRPTPNRTDIIKKAFAYVRYVLASMATNGKVNPVAFIFMAKNYFGMQDKVEQVIEHKDLLGSDKSADEVQSNIRSSIPLEDVKSFDDIEEAVFEEIKVEPYKDIDEETNSSKKHKKTANTAKSGVFRDDKESGQVSLRRNKKAKNLKK